MLKSLKIESLLKYLIAAILIFVPLYPKFPLFNVPGTYVAVRAEDFLIAVLGLSLLICFFKYRQNIFKSATFKALLVYWLVGFISAVSGAFVTKTASPLLGFLHLFRRIEYALPFIAGLILAKNKTNLKFLLEIIPLVSLGVFFYGIAQIYFQAPVIITQNEEYSKGFALTLQPGVNLASTFAGHYDLATYLVLTISLLLAIHFALKNNLLKILNLVLLVFLFWLQLKTGSRIAFFALFASLTLILLAVKRPLWLIPIYLVGVVGLVNTPSISGRFGNLLQVIQFKYLQEKVKGVFDTRGFILVKSSFAVENTEPLPTPTETLRPIQQDRSTSIRIDVEWPRALRAFHKNPALGTGFNSISLATDNDYLRALGETGALGFLAFVTVIISLFTTLIKGLKTKLSDLEHAFLLGTLAGLIGFLIIATFIDVFESSKVATLLWTYLGLATGIVINKKDEK